MLMFMLSMIFIIVFASAGIEFLIVRSSARLNAIYTSEEASDKFKGVIISTVISLVIGGLVGVTAPGVYTGFAIFAATLIGFATNTMTYNFFLKMGKVMTFTKRTVGSAQAISARVADLRKNRFYDDIAGTIKGGIKVIGFAIGTVLFILGLPGLLVRKYKVLQAKLHPAS